MAHLSLNLLFNLYSKKGIVTDITLEMKDQWLQRIHDTQAIFETCENVPMNSIIYEFDMMERGVHLLPCRGFRTSKYISQGLGGAVRFLATGDPSQLLGGIKDG